MRIRSLLLLTGLVFAQASYAQSTGIGIKGGAVVSTAKALNIRTAPIPGATAGIYVPWGIGPRMELQPEIMCSTLGATYTEPDGDSYTVRSIYLQIPLSLKLYINNGLNFSGGYQFGKLLLAQEQESEGNTTVTEKYNGLDMGFVGGIGLDLVNGLDLGLRAYGAMTPSLREDDALFPKNRSLQFTVGYRIVQVKHRRLARSRS